VSKLDTQWFCEFFMLEFVHISVYLMLLMLEFSFRALDAVSQNIPFKKALVTTHYIYETVTFVLAAAFSVHRKKRVGRLFFLPLNGVQAHGVDRSRGI